MVREGFCNRLSVAFFPSGVVEEFPPGVPGTKRAKAVRNISSVVATADGGRDYIAISSPTAITPGVCPDSTVWQWSLGEAAYEVTALNGKGVTQVAEAAGHQYALTCTGDVYVWGTGSLLALGRTATRYTPTLNPQLTSLTNGTDVGVLIDAGSDLGAILVQGQAYVWGNNKQDQCGCGSQSPWLFTPTKVDQSVPFTSIDSGGDEGNDGQTLAIDASGQAWCWGANFDGQCGLGTTANVPVPTEVPGQTAVAQVAAGGDYSLFLGTDGDVWACGDNAQGAVGNGATANQLTPVDVLKGIVTVSAGANHALAAS
jgi:hypothetical protein